MLFEIYSRRRGKREPFGSAGGPFFTSEYSENLFLKVLGHSSSPQSSSHSSPQSSSVESSADPIVMGTLEHADILLVASL